MVVLALLVVACTPVERSQVLDTFSSTPDDGETVVMEDGSTLVLLAGSEDATPIYEFDQVAYDQALADNKKIFLQWYATWCPSCRAEQKISQPFFDSLNESDVIGFRVNFKDKETSDDEENLAREFGVSSQTTKIFIVNGERVQKTPQHFVTQKQYQDAFDMYFN